MFKIPPPVMPEGLSDQEYRRISILYLIMGNRELATEANQKCARADLGGASFNDLSVDEKVDLGSKLGQDFAMKLVQIVEESKDDLAGLPEKLKAALEPLKGVLDEATLEQMAKHAAGSINEAYTEPPPPRKVPVGLSAEEYYKLGKKYKASGWTELAREALTLASELDKAGTVGVSALQYLRNRVPRYPVPLAAEQLNIQGYNLMEVTKDFRAAKRVFLELIEKYPTFEWPYANVGSIYLRAGDLDPAQDHYAETVKINPFYASGWLGLARVHTLRAKFIEAKICANKAVEIDSDKSVAGFISLIEQVEDWNSESTDS